jgi:uncharacterized membrane protein YhaH (DUF805 family)
VEAHSRKASEPPPPHSFRSRGTRNRIWRVTLVLLIGLASLNIWTGGPLFALWVGSRVQGSGPPTMTAVFVVTVVLTAVSLALIRLIALLQEAYAKQGGELRGVRAYTPWLRSMRGERPVYPGESPRLTAPERMLIAVVIVAVALFEVWFFFFSGSPFDQRSGRSERVTQVAAASAHTWPSRRAPIRSGRPANRARL